ncbi:MAG: low-specificity L-threonine aldolase [Ardenticatenales bacterium]
MAIDGYVDLRSDTLTHPTPEMRAAMAEAQVGDDVFGEDPTVRRLEERAAGLMGKEAALFVASGTMGNLVALLVHCGRGDECIVGDEAHTFYYECGGMAALGGIQPRTLPNRPDGTLDVDGIRAAVRPVNVHFPPTRLICLENTHNRMGGAVLDATYMHAVRAVADENDVRVHLDGARLFNAAVALGVPAAALAADADSVTFCLSKGLAAPVGSVLCGSRPFIDAARRARKMVGGGMRQAGVLAAAGIVALDTMVDRLAEDHAHARRLADGLRALPGVTPAPDAGRTNIVVAGLDRPDMDVDALIERMAAEGVRFFSVGPRRFRLVTHWQVTGDDVDRALAAFGRVLA